MMSDLGNGLGTVATAYGAVFLPWAFLYLHDFISDRWQTISRTFVNGILHLFFAFVPLPYIIYYIYLQAILEEPDYKELFAAATAVVFSLYHVLRTLWGLYQLYRFREWALKTARSFESAGYPTTFSTKGSWDDAIQMNARNHTKKGKLGNSASSSDAVQHLSSVPSIEEVIQPVVCNTCNVGGDAAKRVEEIEVRDDIIRRKINYMLVNSSIIDNEFINSYSPFRLSRAFWRMTPLRRKATLVRWAVVYLAQFGQQWLKECVIKHHGQGTWKERRLCLAAKVWATAALRMETECKVALKSRNDSDVDSNFGARSFLDPAEWDKVTLSMEDQLFDKEFVLRKCFSSGTRLPYDCPIIDDFHHPLPSHALYKPLIKEAMESLPSRYYDIVEKITPDHVEWFVVYLWVNQWGGCMSNYNPDTSRDTFGNKGSEKKSNPDTVILAQSDTPVKVLQDQLGFDIPATLDRSAFPFLVHTYGRTFWANRSVLQVSARIDNWIVLCIGRQLAFMLSIEKELGPQGKFFDECHREVENNKSESESGINDNQKLSHERSNAVNGFHKLLETKRLRYQLANANPLHSHLEVGLTFMGCVIENVRSALAETLNTAGQGLSWSPPIPDKKVSFGISSELRNCLIKAYSGDMPVCFNSTIQERLLWECQNGVYYSWQKKMSPGTEELRTNPSAPGTIQAMMLCILGFPGLQVVCKNTIRQGQKFPDPVLEFEVWPVAGPQPLRINMAVNWKSSHMSASICVENYGLPDCAPKVKPSFRWQDWRDAFEGRCIGKSEWQKEHYMKELQIRGTKGSIASGITSMLIGEDDGDRLVPVFRRYLVWDGWRPFRAGMTFFELMHSNLIVVGDDMPTGIIQDGNQSDDLDNVRQYDSTISLDSYARANMADLTDASNHLDGLLILNHSLVQEPGEMTQSNEDDHPETQLVDFAPVHASSSSDGPSFRLMANFDPPLPNTVLSRAQEQDPIAMHILATWVLKGSHQFKKNYFKAVQLMERAIVLGHNIKTGQLLVRTLLDKTFAPDGPIDVDRALEAVELLWRDIVSRHEVITVGTKKVRRWRGDSGAELKRMSKLVELNLKVIDMRPTAVLMQNLANRLSLWGESEEDEETAKRLYESAILAEIDRRSIMELGHKFKKRQPRFAAALYARALKLEQEGVAKSLADLILIGTDVDLKMTEIVAVYEKASEAGHVGATRELGLLLLQGENGISDLDRGKMYSERAVYGDTVALALQQGLSTFEIDSKRAEDLRLAAKKAYGEDSKLPSPRREDVGDDVV